MPKVELAAFILAYCLAAIFRYRAPLFSSCWQSDISFCHWQYVF